MGGSWAVRDAKSSWGNAGRESCAGWVGSGRAIWVGRTSMASSMMVRSDVAADVAAAVIAFMLFLVVLPIFDQL